MLIDSVGHIKLCGFELAVYIDNTDNITDLPSIVTADLESYMAPELLKRQGVLRGYAYKIDYFSMGCVLLEMCTGKSPLQNNVSSGSPRFPWLMKKELKKLIQGLLLSQPNKRYGYKQVRASPFLRDVSLKCSFFIQKYFFDMFQLYVINGTA